MKPVIFLGYAKDRADKVDYLRNPSDRWPWNLYVRPGAEAVARWSQPGAAGDPPFGPPPVPVRGLPSSPFRHLNWDSELTVICATYDLNLQICKEKENL